MTTTPDNTTITGHHIEDRTAPDGWEYFERQEEHYYGDPVTAIYFFHEDSATYRRALRKPCRAEWLTENGWSTEPNAPVALTKVARLHRWTCTHTYMADSLSRGAKIAAIEDCAAELRRAQPAIHAHRAYLELQLKNLEAERV